MYWSAAVVLVDVSSITRGVSSSKFDSFSLWEKRGHLNVHPDPGQEEKSKFAGLHFLLVVDKEGTWYGTSLAKYL
jgi:hypothetical protein